MSYRFVQVLWDEDAFPTAQALQESMLRLSLPFDPRDLHSVVSALFDEPYMEDMGVPSEWLGNSVSISHSLCPRSSGSIQAAFDASLVSLAITQSLNLAVEIKNGILCSSIPCTNLEVAARIHEYELRSKTYVLDPPSDIRGTFQTAQDVGDELDMVDYGEIWERPDLCTMKAWSQHLTSDDRLQRPLREVRVGRDFLNSVRELGVDAKPGSLSAMYRVAMQAACRIDGGDPVRERPSRADGSWLMRAHVSKQGQGYRLHYWESTDYIELDCLKTKAQGV